MTPSAALFGMVQVTGLLRKFALSRIFLGLLFCSASVSVHARTLRCEAEDGVLTGTMVESKIAGYSGRGYVTSLDERNDSIEVTFKVETEGFYTLTIAYFADDPKFNPVFVNGSMQGNRQFPKTKGFAPMTFGRVFLNAGANAVRIGCDWGRIDVDYLEVEPAPAPVPFQLSAQPVNPAASPEARKLFTYLAACFGKRILVGQQDESGQRRSYIADNTGGKAPAIVGFDLLNYSGAYNKPDGQIEKARDWALKRHGIVAFSWHWFSPFGATEEVWRSFSKNKTTFDASRISDETSPEYAAVVRDLDLVAEKLKVLRDAHVPVLWRPLHEAEGAWFWWGARGPDITRQLYRLMFERFTNIHKLNNLLWVWTTTDNPSARSWYPGDEFVDIIGADIYNVGGTRGTYLSVFDNLRQLYGGRKMIALAETDALPDLDQLGKEGADWLWFLIWDDFIEKKELNPPSLLSETYHNRRALTLESLSEATPERLFGILQMSDEHAAADRSSGINVAMLPVSWGRFEPKRGTISDAYVNEIVLKKQALQKLGYKVMLDLGVQYPPAWVGQLPNGRYKNQFGDSFERSEPGENLPNVVFNAEVREGIATYFKNVFARLGADWDYVRLGCGKYGELNYPQPSFKGRENCYWAFDNLARGQASGLPDGLRPCPVPGWLPGTASPQHESARQFAEWYLDCLKNYQDWQITTIRRFYSGDICMLYGSWGIRPGQLHAAIEGDLSGRTPAERNGEIQQGFDWPRMIGAIHDPRVIVYCTWMDGTLQNRDLSDEGSADPARWSPAQWQSSLARKNSLSLRVWGENTGRNTPEAMRLTFEKIRRLNLMGVLWAFESDLLAEPNPKGLATLSDYTRFIRELQNEAVAAGAF